MWNAKIVSKDYTKGVLLIGVEFSSEDETFSKSFDLTGGDEDTLDARIQQELSTLNQTEILAIDVIDTIAAQTVITYKPKEATPVEAEQDI